MQYYHLFFYINSGSKTDQLLGMGNVGFEYRNLERGVLFAWQVKTKLTIDRFCEKSWQVMTEQFWTKKHRPGELFQNSESYIKIIHMQNS